MITDIEDYFDRGCGRCERFDPPDCSTRRWDEGLRRLRAICLDAGLVETVKWGHPCYTHRDRNVAILGAFRGDFRVSFFDLDVAMVGPIVREASESFDRYWNAPVVRSPGQLAQGGVGRMRPGSSGC